MLEQQWRSHVQCDGHKEKSEALFEKMRKGEADLNGDEIAKDTAEGSYGIQISHYCSSLNTHHLKLISFTRLVFETRSQSLSHAWIDVAAGTPSQVIIKPSLF